MLYPLQFPPLFKERLWGSESWEISAVEGDVSKVANGFLKGNDLAELVEIYMGELVGDKNFNRFGHEFPLLIKFIDAKDRLSVQVHPNDELAARRHNAFGKTEMWVILENKPGATLFIGFKPGVTREMYIKAVEDGTVGELLNEIPVRPGDALFIPAGTVHAIGEGIVLAEVQQTSDVTYRIFDWNRVDDKGQPRQLHVEEALDAIEFDAPIRNVTQRPGANEAALLVESEYFTTNALNVDGEMKRSLESHDSFTIYICMTGTVTLKTKGGEVVLNARQCALVPADQDEATLSGVGTLLETYV